MKNKNFLEQLEKLNLPEIETPHYKAKLKLALLHSEHFKKSPKGWRQYFSTFIHNLRTMSFLKKAISASVLSVLGVAVLFTQLNISGIQTVDAKEIVNQAIAKIDKPNSEEQKLYLELLQKAKESPELKYLGEETRYDGKRFKKISFTNPDIGNEIIILIGEKGNEINYRFATTETNLPMQGDTFKLKDGKIADLQALKNKLKNPQLRANPQREFLLHLIRDQNRRFLEREQNPEGFNSLEKSIVDQLKPLVSESEVLITSIAYPGVWMVAEDEFQLQTYPLGNYKVNNKAAQELLDQTIQKLSRLNSPEAKAKLKVLQKAKEASILTNPGERGIFDKKSYDEKGNEISLYKKVKTLVFTQGDEVSKANITTIILIDTEDSSEKAVNFEFFFPGGTDYPGITKIEGRIKDGKVMQPEKILEKLKSKNPHSKDLKPIFEYQNKRLVSELGYIKDGKAIKLGQILRSLIEQSDLLLVWEQSSLQTENEESLLTAATKALKDNQKSLPAQNDEEESTFTLWVYDMGNYLLSAPDQNDQTYAKELIQEAIDKLTPLNSTEAKAKVELLQKAQAASLKYLGEEFNANGGFIKKLSFRNEKLSGEIAIDLNQNPAADSVNFPFVIDGDSVYWGGQKIVGADPATFELFPGQNPANIQYAKDKNFVYQNVKYGDNKIKDADPETFQIIQMPYSKDKKNVYIGEFKLKGADPQTFEVFDGQDTMYVIYGKDKSGIYCGNQKLENSDPTTFQMIGYGYAKDKNRVYYSCSELKGADPATFVLTASNGFAQDKNWVYVNDKKVEGADVKSFQILDIISIIDHFQILSGYMIYAKDKNAVYYYSFNHYTKIEGADPASFRFIGQEEKQEDSSKQKVEEKTFIIGNESINFYEYTRDKANVYYYGESIEGADPETFQILDSQYSKDKNAVYHEKWKVKGADPASFELVKVKNLWMTTYGKDKNSIYYYEFKVPDADVSSFEVLGGAGDYAKDKNAVYQHGWKLKELDPSTFQILDTDTFPAEIKNSLYYAANQTKYEAPHGFYVKDKELAYFNGEKIQGADANTLEVLGGYYAKDKNALYYEGKKITGADIESFKVSIYDPDYATDKNHTYNQGKKVK